MELSAVIPTWCEGRTIAEAVTAARLIADEVIVADGDSPDDTIREARDAGADIVTCAKGRGRQLDAGARRARGSVLLFIHADARLPQDARSAIVESLDDPDVIGGNFLLRFMPDSRWARFFSWANDARRRWLGRYYGDSAIFVRRDVYQALGGFRAMPLMEDYDFAKRLERYGRTDYVRSVTVDVSSRRFVESPGSALAQWFFVQSLYSLGVPPRFLTALYPDTRES